MKPSIARAFPRIEDIDEEAMAEFQEYLESIRGRMDLPFDELYHKEKGLIQEVVEAQKAFDERLNSLPSPMDEFKTKEQRDAAPKHPFFKLRNTKSNFLNKNCALSDDAKLKEDAEFKLIANYGSRA